MVDIFPIEFMMVDHFGVGMVDVSAGASHPLHDCVNQATHIHQCKIGEVATRTLGTTASTFMMLESLSNLGRVVSPQAFGGAFRPLSSLFAAAFSTYYAVSGAKMLIDGRREYLECRSRQNRVGAVVALIRMIEGGFMVLIGAISGVLTTIFFEDLFSLHTPLQAMKSSLSTLSQGVWGLYSVIEAVGAYREWRKYAVMEKDLATALGPKGNDFQTGLVYLKHLALPTPDEIHEINHQATSISEAQQNIVKLAQAREDVFCLTFGRRNFLRVRDGSVAQAKEIVLAAKKYNEMKVKMALVNTIIYLVSIVAVIGCFIFAGGIPVIAGAIVMSAVSLVATALNTRRIFLDWENKEIGKWDQWILIASMLFFTLTMIAAVMFTGPGALPLAVFGVTGGAILALKAVALIKLTILKKKREKEVEEINSGESPRVRPFREYDDSALDPVELQPLLDLS